MQKKIIYLVFSVAVLFHVPVWSQTALPACYQDLATNFFKYEIVAQAFSMHNVNQNTWSTLISQLQNQAKNVPQLIQQQAQKINPNPLSPTFQVEPATQLLHDVLFAVFYQVLVNNYITLYTNQISITNMFQYIWLQQLQAIQNCLGSAAIKKYILTQ